MIEAIRPTANKTDIQRDRQEDRRIYWMRYLAKAVCSLGLYTFRTAVMSEISSADTCTFSRIAWIADRKCTGITRMLSSIKGGAHNISSWRSTCSARHLSHSKSPLDSTTRLGLLRYLRSVWSGRFGIRQKNLLSASN